MTIPVWGYSYENLASSDVYARCIGLQHRPVFQTHTFLSLLPRWPLGSRVYANCFLGSAWWAYSSPLCSKQRPSRAEERYSFKRNQPEDISSCEPLYYARNLGPCSYTGFDTSTTDLAAYFRGLSPFQRAARACARQVPSRITPRPRGHSARKGRACYQAIAALS